MKMARNFNTDDPVDICVNNKTIFISRKIVHKNQIEGFIENLKKYFISSVFDNFKTALLFYQYFLCR